MTDNKLNEVTDAPAADAVDTQQLQRIIEAALFAAERPLSIDNLLALYGEHDCPPRKAIRSALKNLQAEYAERGVQLVEVASGFRFQVSAELTPWIKRLWHKRSPRYSRALLETLAVIAYRQPITRSEIEAIRGVSVSTAIMKSLQDYQWIRVLGHRETPGRPALYGTTRAFLDHFSLKSLDALPTLAQLKARTDSEADNTEVVMDTAQLQSELPAEELPEVPDELEVEMVEVSAEILNELDALVVDELPVASDDEDKGEGS